jgi:hypothetical protein
MILYLASAGGYFSVIKKHKDVNILQSYIAPKDIYKFWKEFNNKKIFLDSGAFSAFTLNKKIDINDYIKFIKENFNKIKVYSTLDVIGDYKKTEENTLYMEANGLKPLPTFHYKSPISELIKLIEKYNYIALGGLVPIMRRKTVLKNWLDRCFAITKDKIKVHGFGVNTFWTWKRYPFYSVDATSWLSSSRYGGTIKKMDSKKLIFYNKKVHYLKRTEDYLKELLIKEKYTTELWKKRGIVWNN